MREVLAHATTRLQHLAHRRAHRGFAGRVFELAMQLRHERIDAVENRTARGKALGCIVGEFLLHAHVRRFVAKAARLEILARRKRTMIGKIRAQLLPRHAVRSEYLRPWICLDIHLGHDLEPAMQLAELDAGDDIAEGVDLVAPPEGCRIHADRVFQALLKRRRPRYEMQYVMRMQHVACVLVGRFVMDAVAHVPAHVHTERASPVCEKCRMDRRSESSTPALYRA